ncbi:MAG: hypothetical protein LBD01_03245 [Puniceicoccales bacterium]|jgi:penicillin-binding protein 2|nr:hypothetical protein [Puniceicoccales bacterium]
MSDIKSKTIDIPLWRLFLVGGIAFAAFCAVIVRLSALQLFNYENYTEAANTQSRRLVIIPAPRGNIYDRNGKLLVANRPSHNIVADVTEQNSRLKKEFDREYSRLMKEDNLLRTIRARRKNNPAFTAEHVRRERDKRAGELRIISYVNVLKRYLDKTNRLLGRQDSLRIASIRKHFSHTRTIPITIARDLSEEQLARFIEAYPVDHPLKIVTQSIRIYPFGESAAHILGYVRNDRDDVPQIPYSLEDSPFVAEFLAQPEKLRKRHILKQYGGQKAATGVEAYFDEQHLQGTPGYQMMTVRPSGFAYATELDVPSIQGESIDLSLDIDLQIVAEKSIAQRFPDNRASIVMLDVNTGEVLVCANAPSYDLARMSLEPHTYSRELEEKHGAGVLLNRATRGLYPAGSSFKPITAIAALRSGAVTPDETLECESYIERGNPPRKFVEHDGRAFGEVDVARMLEVSSNVFCYLVSERMGIKALAGEAKRFGLDSRNTFELSTDRGLVIPTPEYKASLKRGGWALGDTLNTAIGQGDVLTTPLHLACLAASIARNETRTDATILRIPPEHLPVKHSGTPIGLTPEQYQTVVHGMVDCAKTGTGRLLPRGLKSTVASKTGTAQVKNKTAVLAWVMAYVPVEKPQVALVVMVESQAGDRRLGGGSSAAPIANDILKAWEKKYAVVPGQ